VRAASTLAAVALLAAATSACRPDPGKSRYEEQEPFPMGGDSRLPGPNPYHVGDKRLSVGAFYEGDASDTVAVDNANSNLYVYEETVGLQSDPEHIEGLSSTRVTHTGKAWCGFGIHWMAPREMTAWTKLHVSMKSSDAAFATIDIAMNNVMPVPLHASSYGWAADGQWHNLVIPVADFVAAHLDASVVAAPFTFAGGPGMGGEVVLIDDLYFTAD
jgi:hypothetical protein